MLLLYASKKRMFKLFFGFMLCLHFSINFRVFMSVDLLNISLNKHRS